jgi:hypothetical protein
VADVHTQPTDYYGAVVGNVLHVGNGLINMGVFFAENPCHSGHLMAFAGPVSSFHQVITSQFERLTDQEWEEKFLSVYNSNPDRPDWVGSYLLDRSGNLYQEGRALKGAVYSGTGTNPAPDIRPLDYLLVFPNPASREANIRFVLNEKSNFWVEVYDGSGRLVHGEQSRTLEPAEHNMVIPVERWEKGLYLLRIGIGKHYEARQLLVQ